jgi:hypothetical protein
MLKLEVGVKEMKLDAYLDYTGEIAPISSVPPIKSGIRHDDFLTLPFSFFNSSGIDLREVIKW